MDTRESLVQNVDNTFITIPSSHRRVMHIDMNSFFASVEEQANPFLRGKSIGVAGGIEDFNAILAASYEAKAHGIKTGTKVRDAKILDPNILIVPMDHNKYYDYSVKILNIFREYCPTVEAYSVDEAFLDFTSYERDWNRLREIAFDIKNKIKTELGESIRCSIGISTNKLLAKVGSDYKKPDGLTIIKYEERYKYLDTIKIPDIWGFGRAISYKLGIIGIVDFYKLRYLSPVILRDVFGGYYHRILTISHGDDYSYVKNTLLTEDTYTPKSMQHAHVIGVPYTDVNSCLELTRKLSEKLSNRLLKYDVYAKEIFFRVRDQKVYGVKSFTTLPFSTRDGLEIFSECKKQFQEYYKKREMFVKYIAVGVQNFEKKLNYNLFEEPVHNTKIKYDRDKVISALDKVNKRWGNFTIKSADILFDEFKNGKVSVERPHFGFHG